MKALERCGVASEAARLAGTGVRNAFKRRKGNPTFAAAWDAAVALHRSEAGRQAMSAVAAEGVAYNQGADGAKLIRAGRSRWSARGEETFLMELTMTANVKRAAAAAGFSTAAVYKRRMKDSRFAAAWDAAIEAGKARLQSYLIEMSDRTFDPDSLPLPEGQPRVSVSEAVSILRLKGREPSPHFAEGSTVTADEHQAAVDRIVARLGKLKERMDREKAAAGWTEHDGEWVPPGFVKVAEARCARCGGALSA